MLLNKTGLTCLLTIVSFTALTVEAGGPYFPTVGCHNGMNAPCAPKRVTFGYSTTCWRRWPTDRMTEKDVAKPEEIPTPTPAKSDSKTEPAKDDTGPSIVPEPDNLVPTEPDGPRTEPILSPTEDSPPEPPAESPTTPETPDALTLPDAEPKEAAPMPPTTMDDLLEPKAEDQDPFKDEPTPAPDSGAARTRGRSNAADNASVRWRTSSSAPMANQGPPKRLAGAPARLPAAPVTAGNVNPLRATANNPKGREVVPAANWATEETLSASKSDRTRRNPLRAN